MKRLILWGILIAMISTVSYADVIYLKNGNQIKTSQAWKEGDFVKCYRFGDNIMSYHQDQVIRVIKGDIVKYDGNGKTKDGFRGLTWGMHISKIVKELTYIKTDPSSGGVKKYTRKIDKLEIGGAKLKVIFYDFWQDKLIGVSIHFTGFTNYINLLQTAKKRFGHSYRPNRFMEKYIWHGQPTYRSIEFSKITKKGSMVMMSEELSEKMDAYDNQIAKEGQKDF